MSAHHTYTVAIARLFTKRFFLLLFAGLFFVLGAPAGVTHAQVASANSQTCGSVSVQTHSFGTGMIAGLTQLSQSVPQVTVLRPNEGCAVITWDTSAPSASLVIALEGSDATSAPVITLSEKNYGYTLASTQDNSGAVHHVAIIKGLQPNKIYAYRVVSRAFPTALPVISQAYSLIQAPSAQTRRIITATVVPSVTTQVRISLPPTPSKKTVSVLPTSSATPSKNRTATTSVQPTVVPSALAAVGSALGDATNEQNWWKSIQAFIASEQGRTQIVHYLWYALLISIFGIFVYLFAPFSLASLRPKNPIIYALIGSAVLAMVSAAFLLYYLSLVSIALFLGILAWFLLSSMPEEESDKAPVQPRLIATPPEKPLLDTSREHSAKTDTKY